MSGCESDRRILYLSMDRVAVYHRHGGKCAWPFLFDVGGHGLQHFHRYLQETPRITTCILVDVGQEEFRQDVLPHVSVSDRQAIIARKKQQYFRDTPYFHAEIQGRAAEGRRDDIVLYTALTSPALIRPWAELLLEHKVPFAGICSIPRLTGWLLDYLPGAHGQRLVVSLHSIGGLRQTCFLNDKLQMSRLVDLPFGNATTRVLYIHAETEVMLRYLHSMGTLDPTKPLAICYLADGPILEELRGKTINTAQVQHYFVDVAGLATQIGLTEKIAVPFCDQLLIHLLFLRKIPNYYATRDELRYYHRRNALRIVHAASAGLMFTGLCWCVLNYIDGAAYSRRAVSVTEKADYFSSMNRIARSRLPETGIAPAELRTLGAMALDLEQQKAVPFGMLRLISKGMEQFPSIQVDRIEWNGSPDSAAGTAAAGSVSIAGKNINDPAPAEKGEHRLQMATMYGYISPFHGDYRGALDMIDAFRAELGEAAQVRDVDVLSLPLDTGPGASLEGSSIAAPGVARFSLRIVLESQDET